ncbi:hypothetical protein [Salinicola sp. NYA28a]
MKSIGKNIRLCRIDIKTGHEDPYKASSDDTIGGCPYANGGSGNVATEDVIYPPNGFGIDGNVDLDTLAETGVWITQTIGKPNRSKVGVALAAK